MGCVGRRRKYQNKENSLAEISSANVNGLDLRLARLGMAVWAKGKWVLSCKEIGCWMRIYPYSTFWDFFLVSLGKVAIRQHQLVVQLV